jgi:hypothetical protein
MFRMRLALVLGIVAGCGSAEEAEDPRALPEDVRPTEGDFMVAVLPDTQAYTTGNPEAFEAQTKWIADYAERYDIVFVTHVGDIVQGAKSQSEWAVAQAAYDWLEDKDIPHGFSVGGHDVSDWGGWQGLDRDSSCSPFDRTDCDAVEFLENFGPDRYAGRDWYLGASPSGQSSAQLVTAGGLDLLFLHLPQDAPRAEVDWAHEVLDANPGTVAHLTTHRYLFDYRLTDALPAPLNLLKAGRFNAATYILGGQSLMYDDGLEADQLFEELVASHPNIWGLHCGHVDAEFQLPDVNDAGLPVHQVLVDFQNMEDGGGGWMRLLWFRPARDEVEVLTWSPVTHTLREDGDGLDHSIDILTDYKNEAVGLLDTFGITEADIDAFLELLRTEGTPEREAYAASLYDGGARDSRFTLEVDLSAYVEASR